MRMRYRGWNSIHKKDRERPAVGFLTAFLLWQVSALLISRCITAHIFQIEIFQRLNTAQLENVSQASISA